METQASPTIFATEQTMASSPLEALLEAAGDATFHLNEHGQVTFSSRMAKAWAGVDKFGVGSAFVDLFDPMQHVQVQASVAQVLQQGQVAKFTAALRTGAGGPFAWTLCRYVAGPKKGVLAVAHNTLPQQELQLKLTQVESYDGLTSLPNRVTTQDLCKKMMAQAQRSGQTFSFALVSVSGVTRINSAMGNATGDVAIVRIAERLSTFTNGRAVVTRTGPTEFGLLFTETLRHAELLRYVRQVVALLEGPYFFENNVLHVKALAGATTATDEKATVDEVFSGATQALHQAKEFSQVAFIELAHEGIKAAQDFMHLEAALHQGVNNGELYLSYQPLVSKDGLYGVEALMRWRREDGSEISPGLFIPIAEKDGLIQMLGEWALRCAAHEVAAFNKTHGLKLQVSVNVSPVQFLNPGFLQLVKSVLRKSGIEAGLLQLEVTEGALMSAPSIVEPLLKTLAEMDIKIAVDDFGTGYSSLAYLKRFAISTLKIDQSFVKGLPESEADLAVCSVIADLAKKLKLKVVAEGIETEEQLATLKALIPEGGYQGYLLGRPAPLSTLIGSKLNLPYTGA
jgi:diguanylate cyclase (GGDEF)-like protein